MVDITKGPGPNTTTITGPRPTQGPAPVDPYANPGSDLFDWYSINDALRAASMGDGSWQIAGANHSPVQTVEEVKNPAYDPLKNPDVDPFTKRDRNDYTIGVVNANTGQLVKLHLTKSAPGPDGKYTYTVANYDIQGKLDRANPGYTNPEQLQFKDGHKELWGTNTATGAFEKMPGSPPNLGTTNGWNDIKQIDSTDAQGRRVKIWVGTNPDGEPMQPVPGSPSVVIDKYVPGSVKQVTKNGKQVYVGQNAQTQGWEEIPELGNEPVKQTAQAIGKNVYTTDPQTGQLIRATSIAQPQENQEQWIDAADGYAKRQVFTNGDWHDDTDTPWKPVNPATQRALGALKQKGEKYYIPLNGSSDTLIEVTADGNGGYTYEMGPNGEPPNVKKIPGIREPTAVTGGSPTDEFLPQRRDPITQQLLPPEKNINWSPTSAGDRVRQLQQLAQAKQQEIHQQVTAGVLSEDDADKQFNTWWDQNVEPGKQEIQLAQQTKAQDLARQNLSVAQNAGQAAVTATAGQHYVGPGFGDFWSKISQGYGKDMPNNITADDFNRAFVTPAQDYSKVYEQATAQALQHISPTAAGIVNGPGATPTALQQPQDITAGLARNPYLYHPQQGGPQMTPMPYTSTGGPPPMTPMPAAAGTPAPEMVPMAAGTPATPAVPQSAFPTTPMATTDYSSLLARMAADRAEQLRQSQAMLPTTWNAWSQPYQFPT